MFSVKFKIKIIGISLKATPQNNVKARDSRPQHDISFHIFGSKNQCPSNIIAVNELL